MIYGYFYMCGTDSLKKNIFCSAFHNTTETKLQSFQQRILYRPITCKNKIGGQSDDIRNLFYFVRNQKLCQSFILWWNRVSDTNIALHYEFLVVSTLFGFQANRGISNILNDCVLNGKSYIQNQKLFYENALDFMIISGKPKYKLQIEE